jgi:hypothetical protein
MLSLVIALNLGAASFSRESPCDLPGHDLGGKNGLPAAAASAKACEARCAGLDGCEAFVFVSGWNRCFPKARPGKKALVRFYSGEIAVDGKVRTVVAAGFDRDYSGKDLRRVEHVASGEECGALCVGEPACKAFAYIGGYSDCWLKKTRGEPREKVFSCGIKKH